MELRDAAGHVVVGGGVLGLSAARRLAERGADVLVLDKGRIGGGASGAAGGIVRNYYRAPAITDVVRLSVEMFEADPEAFGFRPVGYLAAVPEAQVDDLVAINGRHRECGYESELVVGEGPCSEYLGWTWPDWEAPIAALLHERRGGWADPMRTVRRLAELARAAGAEIAEGVEVTGIESGEAGVEVVETSRGRISCERLRSPMGRPRRGSSSCGPPPPALARARSRPSCTSTRPGRCARTRTVACSSTVRGGSTSASAPAARR